MSYLFYGCELISSLKLCWFEYIKYRTLEYLFYDYKNLISSDKSNFNTPKVINMSHLFGNCEKVNSLKFQNLV